MARCWIPLLLSLCAKLSAEILTHTLLRPLGWIFQHSFETKPSIRSFGRTTSIRSFGLTTSIRSFGLTTSIRSFGRTKTNNILKLLVLKFTGMCIHFLLVTSSVLIIYSTLNVDMCLFNSRHQKATINYNTEPFTSAEARKSRSFISVQFIHYTPAYTINSIMQTYQNSYFMI